MKKYLSIIITVLIVFGFSTITAFAEDGNSKTIDNDKPSQLDEYVEIESDYSTRASNLITQKKTSLSKNGTALVIKAETGCVAGVVKCGFTYIKVQQYRDGKWVDYKTINDIHSTNRTCKYSMTFAAAKGYKYRVTAKHYARKSLLNTETAVSTSSTITL